MGIMNLCIKFRIFSNDRRPVAEAFNNCVVRAYFGTFIDNYFSIMDYAQQPSSCFFVFKSIYSNNGACSYFCLSQYFYVCHNYNAWFYYDIFANKDVCFRYLCRRVNICVAGYYRFRSGFTCFKCIKQGKKMPLGIVNNNLINISPQEIGFAFFDECGCDIWVFVDLFFECFVV